MKAIQLHIQNNFLNHYIWKYCFYGYLYSKVLNSHTKPESTSL